jgi:type VI protein secretion system component Hcp
MAVDAYMAFQTYDGKWLGFESQTDLSKNKEPLMTDAPAFPGSSTTSVGQMSCKNYLELEDYSFDIEQTLNIGSQSKGAGAGKITFNPFSITRKIDIQSPIFFMMACSGTSFKLVQLGLRKSAGGDTAGVMFVRFDFKLVAVKTISWAHDDEAPKETVTFEYGGLQVRYSPQLPSGAMQPSIPGGWNRVANTKDLTADAIV